MGPMPPVLPVTVVMCLAADNVFMSWHTAGYITAVPSRARLRPAGAGPGAAAFALFLGWLEGARGENLFRTRWAAVLDRSLPERVDLATAAAKRGMLDFLNAGGVMEIRFPGYLTTEEQDRQ